MHLIVTFTKAEVMKSGQLVCHSVSVYAGLCKSNQLISLKLGVMMRPTNR